MKNAPKIYQVTLHKDSKNNKINRGNRKRDWKVFPPIESYTQEQYDDLIVEGEKYILDKRYKKGNEGKYLYTTGRNLRISEATYLKTFTWYREFLLSSWKHVSSLPSKIKAGVLSPLGLKIIGAIVLASVTFVLGIWFG